MLGLDFGTTYCRVAYAQYSDVQGRYAEPQLVEFGGRPALRCVLCLDETGEKTLEYGEDVYETGLASQFPDRVRSEFKFTLGQDEDANRWTRLLLKEARRVTAQTFIPGLLADTQAALGLRGGQALDERFEVALLDAARSAGFPEPHCVAESLAVMGYHAASGDLGTPVTPGLYCVVNSGGAFTECAIVRVPEGDDPPTVVYSTISLYGGRDFDQVLVSFIHNRYGISVDAPSQLQLGHFAEGFKEVFAERVKAGQPKYERHCPLPRIRGSIVLSQADFEHPDVAGGLIERFHQLVARALADSGVSVDDVLRVLVAGGNGRWYFVEQALEQTFGSHKVLIPPRPEETVVKGLALSLAEQAGKARTGWMPEMDLADSDTLEQLLAPTTAAERAQPGPSPRSARALELLGLVGFLGIGWMYSGYVLRGVVMLVGWWLLLGLSIILLLGLAPVTFGLSLLLLVLLWIGVPVLSGRLVSSSMADHVGIQSKDG